MSEDYRVNRRNDSLVRQIAQRAKIFFGVNNIRPVNIIRCLEKGSIRTEYGQKKLFYKKVPDHELPDSEAVTCFSPGVVTIVARQSVHEKAFVGDGRARMTLAHELGHAVMHEGSAYHRHLNAVGATRLSQLSASESAEHQAKVFAAAFLIDYAVASTLKTPEDISVEFGISLEAAKICYVQVARKTEKAESAERIAKIAENFRRSQPGPLAGIKQRFVEGECDRCGEPTMISLGAKYYCATCKTAGNKFQNGD